MYDRYGNRSDQNQTYGNPPMNHVTIDAAHNRISGSPYAYDASGNMTNDGNNTLVYDGENRLVSATNGSSSGTYTYDGKGQRVQKVSGSTTTVTLFLGSQVMAEYVNGAAPSSPTNEYIYAGGQRIASIQSGTTNYWHSDNLSPRVRTDTNGHFPFGETWYSPTGAPYIFTTYYRDSESGNDYAQARYNINRLGRFSSPDPLGGDISDPQSLNRYPYVLNSPLNLVDPVGLSDCPDMKPTCGDDWIDLCNGSPGVDLFGGIPGGGGCGAIPGCPNGVGATSMCIDKWGNIAGSYNGEIYCNGPYCSYWDASKYSWVPCPPFSQCQSPNPGSPYLGGLGSGSWGWNATKSFVNGWFTQGLSDQAGSCTAVFLNSVQNSGVNALRSAATNLQKYGQAVASGLANAGPQAEEAIAAMVAGGQLNSAVGAVSTNIITGTAPLALAASPYVVRVGGYAVLAGFDALLYKGVADEVAAIKKGQCKP